MFKIMTATTALLGLAFFEMSGGADFEPGMAQAATATPVETEATDSLAPYRVAIAFPADQYDYVPFNDPVIVPVQVAEAPVATEGDDAMIVKAAYGAEPEGITLVSADDTPRPDLRIVTGDWVNVRSGASTANTVIDTVARDTEVQVLGTDGDWVQVELLQSGQIGWMASWLLSD